ncbi:MAG: Txe/YoeB family addiction module toxin [Trichlorobacter sp.]|uniref:Txe/YoeB family addiction module toxin n=1 Tax=Trichlorobacter sp. TaxID=2911007 RepID=UPI002561543E|nr:Txe/YoeB family addiction module toxin [Trichlorobacter sp.]
MKISLTPNALDDLRWWLVNDRKRADRILALLGEVVKTPFEGTGKPEPLKHQLAGCWSRRIDREHRLVYQVTDQEILVVGCRHHY